MLFAILALLRESWKNTCWSSGPLVCRTEGQVGPSFWSHRKCCTDPLLLMQRRKCERMPFASALWRNKVKCFLMNDLRDLARYPVYLYSLHVVNEGPKVPCHTFSSCGMIKVLSCLKPLGSPTLDTKWLIHKMLAFF